MNWAAAYRLPVLFVCEDNTFSAFTHSRTTTAGPGPLARAESCGVSGEMVDGNDVEAVRAAALRLTAAVRGDGGPRFLWARTYRFGGHTSTDPAAYRDPADLETAKLRDPLLVTRKRLLAMGASASAIDAIDSASAAMVAEAQEKARAAPFPAASNAFTDVQDLGAPA